MTVNPVRLQNYVASTKIDPSSCRGLEDEYAPEAVATLLGPEASGIAIGAGYLKVDFNNWIVRTNNASAKTNFATDEVRRSFDAQSPIVPGEIGS